MDNMNDMNTENLSPEERERLERERRERMKNPDGEEDTGVQFTPEADMTANTDDL